MKTQSTDTHPKAESAQITLIRQASIAKRITLMHSLSITAMQLSRRAILRSNPGMNKAELDVAFVALNYGQNLADRFEKYIQNR